MAVGEARAVAAVIAERLRGRIAALVPEAGRGLSAEECLTVLAQRRSEWPIRDLGAVLRELERARFAPAVGDDVVALAQQVDDLLGTLPSAS
jgi:hypothetical protein